jgi:GNAT superfamily N-acetyltransferase
VDTLTLALTMQRLAVWLDHACQPAGFIQKQYDGPPFGRCYVSIDPSRQGPYASANWNRIHLCGAESGLRPDGIAGLIDQFRKAGVARFFAWVSPGPEMDAARTWLKAAGFAQRIKWTRYPTLYLDDLKPASFKTELKVREVRPEDIADARVQLGDTMWQEYAISAGKKDFFHFMAFDGRRPVAIGALAAFGRLGYLTAAATAEGDRQRGAQSALIAKRIDKAREIGCKALAVETLTMLQHSLRNLERAGFRVMYEKEIYEWHASAEKSDTLADEPSPRSGEEGNASVAS